MEAVYVRATHFSILIGVHDRVAECDRRRVPAAPGDACDRWSAKAGVLC